MINFAPIIDARGADPGQIAILRAEMKGLAQQMPRMAAAVMADRGRAWR